MLCTFFKQAFNVIVFYVYDWPQEQVLSTHVLEMQTNILWEVNTI